MENKNYIDKDQSFIFNIYNRYPVVLEKGDGVYLYDVDGKKYLDFAAGIAVFALGYNHPKYNEIVKKQVDTLIHTSNLYYNKPSIEAAEKMVKASGLAKVFFTNSGTEAIEGALKTAKKYGYRRDGHDQHEIIAMNHSFHGRSTGALSLTGNVKYQKAFPLIQGVKFAEYNQIDSVKALINEKTCAIILEPVQGEGGIYVGEEAFLKELRAICDEKDILLIFDEIQCGMGRTGEMFMWQHYQVKPDIMACAKALGCGLPVGAFLVNDKVANHSLEPGDHGTTYGGNPLATAAVNAVFDIYEEENILENVHNVSRYLEEKLDILVTQYDFVTERRGIGLIQGLVIEGKNLQDIINGALKEGLILISAGGNVLRMVPPLVIQKEHVDEMIDKLVKVFKY